MMADDRSEKLGTSPSMTFLINYPYFRFPLQTLEFDEYHHLTSPIDVQFLSPSSLHTHTKTAIYRISSTNGLLRVLTFFLVQLFLTHKCTAPTTNIHYQNFVSREHHKMLTVLILSLHHFHHHHTVCYIFNNQSFCIYGNDSLNILINYVLK